MLVGVGFAALEAQHARGVFFGESGFLAKVVY
jgi:hypothetical protein